ncbi:unnamed protein product [Leuciscus chuanchicus]
MSQPLPCIMETSIAIIQNGAIVAPTLMVTEPLPLRRQSYMIRRSTFYSARWNSTTNPDLAFPKWHNNQPLPVRHILDMFPRSHHRPSLITIPTMVQPVQGRDAKRWNFRKANWAGFTTLVNQAAAGLPHQCHSKMLLAAAKKNIPRDKDFARTTSTRVHELFRAPGCNSKMNIMVDNTRLQPQPFPTYLGVKLDRTLSFRQHLDTVKAKTNSRAVLIWRLAGTTWGTSTKTLCISTETLVFSSAEYFAQAWCRSPHVIKLDTALNTALRTVSGCLRATPTNQMPVLGGIAPAEVRREGALLALAREAQASESHFLHKSVTETPQRMRLKSRRPFATHAKELLRTTPADICKAAWVKAKWRDQ